MRKTKGIKRPSVKSKSPGAAPKSSHRDPSPNLGKWLHPTKGLPKGTKIGGKNAAKSVANQIRKTAKDRVYS